MGLTDTIPLSELRELVRIKATENGHVKTWIVSATREAMENYIRTGELASSAPAQAPDGMAGFLAAIESVARLAAEKALSSLPPTRAGITINLPARPEPVEVDGSAHPMIRKTLRLLQVDLPVLLVGPSGTGKTSLAVQAGKCLQLPTVITSFSAGASEASIIGRTLPEKSGEWLFRNSPLLDGYADGALLILDEIDAADANVAICLNALLANGHVTTESGNVKRHEATRIVATANTWGTGADFLHVGRNALDAATLDRFVGATLFVDYSTELESSIIAGYRLESGIAVALTNWVHAVRSQVQAAKLRRIVSTRLVKTACARLSIGDSLSEIATDYFRPYSETERKSFGELVNGVV